MRSTAAVGRLLTKVPAGQLLHGVHEVMLFIVLNEPGAQGVHDRLAVAEPGWEMEVPALQMVMSTQAVAGLPSSSHVSPMQEAAAALAPAQYCPARQGAHTGADDAVPDPV
jgi:hypothetical protein